MADLRCFKPGIGNGVAHGHVRIGGGIAHEALLLAFNLCFEVNLGHAGHLAAQAKFGVFGNMADAAAPFAQCCGDAGLVIAQAGNDAHAGDDDTTHA